MPVLFGKNTASYLALLGFNREVKQVDGSEPVSLEVFQSE